MGWSTHHESKQIEEQCLNKDYIHRSLVVSRSVRPSHKTRLFSVPFRKKRTLVRDKPKNLRIIHIDGRITFARDTPTDSVSRSAGSFARFSHGAVDGQHGQEHHRLVPPRRLAAAPLDLDLQRELRDHLR